MSSLNLLLEVQSKYHHQEESEVSPYSSQHIGLYYCVPQRSCMDFHIHSHPTPQTLTHTHTLSHYTHMHTYYTVHTHAHTHHTHTPYTHTVRNIEEHARGLHPRVRGGRAVGLITNKESPSLQLDDVTFSCHSDGSPSISKVDCN